MNRHGEEKKEIRAVLNKTDPKLWSSLRPEDRNKVINLVANTVSTVTFQQSTSMYTGPIPDPKMLGEYNDVMTHGAERIMQMAEEQSQHRMRLEAATVASQNKQSERGQTFALASVILLIGAGGWATYLGATAIACTIFGTTVLGMGGVFAFGKFAMRRSLSQKAQNKRES